MSVLPKGDDCTVTLLSKIFIKNRTDVTDSAVRRAYGMICGVVGIMLNVILFACKFTAGYLTGSVAITADSFNNLSDAGSSLITLIGFKLSGRKPDTSHPFGHGRIEYIAGLAVSALIVIMGAELFKTSVGKIIHPEEPDGGYFILTVCILVFSVLVKVYMAFYNSKTGRLIKSETMKAAAADSLSDTIATFVVLISSVISHYTSVNIDGYAGIIVALFIISAGIGAAKDTINPLLGQTPDPEVVSGIKKVVLSHNEICGIHDMVIHDYGPGRFMVSLHAEVPGDRNIFEVRDVIDRIETELYEKYHCEATIHMDPVDINNKAVNEAKEKTAELVREIDEGITIHDFRMVPGNTHTNCIFDTVIPLECKKSDEEIKQLINKKIKEIDPAYVAVVRIDRGYV